MARNLPLRTVLGLAVVVGVAAVAAASTTASPTATPQTIPRELRPLYQKALKEGSVNVYISLIPSTVAKIQADISKVFPGLNVRLIQMAGNVIQQKMAAEFDARKVEGDFVIVGEGGWFEDLRKKGLLKRVYAQDFAEFPTAFRGGGLYSVKVKGKTVRRLGGYYFGTQVYVEAIAYNKRLVPDSDVPKSWNDVAKFGSSAGTYDPRVQAGGFALVKGISKTVGVQYWRAVSRAGVRFSISTGDLTTRLANGQLKVIATAINPVIPLRKAGAPVEVVYPKEGSFAFSAFGGIPTGAPHPNAAELIFRYFMSKPGQRLLNKYDCTYPPRADVQVCEYQIPRLDKIPGLMRLTIRDFTVAHDETQAAAAQAAGVG